MASIEECWLGMENYDREWNDLKPFLIQYLPHDLAQVDKVQRLIAKRRYYFERGSQAENKEQKVRAFWYYCQALATARHIGRLVDLLGECGLQAQEEAKRQRKCNKVAPTKPRE